MKDVSIFDTNLTYIFLNIFLKANIDQDSTATSTTTTTSSSTLTEIKSPAQIEIEKVDYFDLIVVFISIITVIDDD